MSSTCVECERAIRGETGYMCKGYCGRMFHDKCTGLTDYERNLLTVKKNIIFLCDECVRSGDGLRAEISKLKNVIENMQNNDAVVKCKCEENIMKMSAVISDEINVVVQQMRKEIKSELVKFCENQSNVKRNEAEEDKNEMVEMKRSLIELSGEIKKLGESGVKNSVAESGKSKIVSEIKKVVDDKSKEVMDEVRKIGDTKVPKKETYADQIKKCKSVVVKPRNKQAMAKTREDLWKCLDPAELRIREVRNVHSGVVTIYCEESEKLVSEVKDKLKENYNVKVAEIKKPRICIYGMSEYLEESDVEEKLKKQNDKLKDSGIKCIKVRSVEKSMNGKKWRSYNAIVELDHGSFEKIMVEKKINIGWDRCGVYEDFNLSRCYNCQAFNHKASKCKNESRCLK